MEQSNSKQTAGRGTDDLRPAETVSEGSASGGPLEEERGAADRGQMQRDQQAGAGGVAESGDLSLRTGKSGERDSPVSGR